MNSPTLLQITPLEFMTLLYADAQLEPGLMEFRLLPSRQQMWMPFPLFEGEEITLERLDSNQSVYFGISLRKSIGQGGRDGCHPTHLLWADLDLKDSQWCESKTPELLPAETISEACVVRFEALMGECAVAGLRPRAVTYSGHGLQVYFACSVQHPPAETEAMNKALARMLEGDLKVYDVARIFRVPGSQNLKNPQRPLTVELWYVDEGAVNNALDLPGILAPYMQAPAVQAAPIYDYERAPNFTELSPPEDSEAARISVIAEYNACNPIEHVLERYGYSRDGDRYTRPGEGASGRDTVLMRNAKGVMCSYHHSSSDPLSAPGTDGNTHLLEPFDVYCQLEHDGDYRAAVRETARKLGLSAKSRSSGPGGKISSDGGTKEESKARAKATKGGKKDEPEILDYLEKFTVQEESLKRTYKFHQGLSSWYEYDGGVYCDMSDEAVAQRIDLCLQGHGFRNLSAGKVLEVQTKLRRMDSVGRKGEDLDALEINLKNGILDLQTLEKRNHSVDYFSTVQSAAQYRPDLVAYAFLEFLENAIPDERNREILQMYAGLCLTGITSTQRALLLTGEGGTGKGTFIYVLEQVLGGLSTSSALENIEDGSFLIGTLVGKRLCVVSELSRMVDWLPFKRVTGEDRITVNVKNRAPYVTKLDIKLIILSNVIPFLGDDATNTSLTRRFLIVPFNVKPGQVDPFLRDRLTTPTELSGVLNWALEGLAALLERGLRFPEPENNAVESAMKEKSNHCIVYAKDELRKGGEVASSDLYKHYKNWAIENGYYPYASNKFVSDMLPAALREMGWIVTRTRKNSGQVWEGLHV